MNGTEFWEKVENSQVKAREIFRSSEYNLVPAQ
jgi:hypothetical protein